MGIVTVLGDVGIFEDKSLLSNNLTIPSSLFHLLIAAAGACAAAQTMRLMTTVFFVHDNNRANVACETGPQKLSL